MKKSKLLLTILMLIPGIILANEMEDNLVVPVSSLIMLIVMSLPMNEAVLKPLAMSKTSVTNYESEYKKYKRIRYISLFVAYMFMGIFITAIDFIVLFICLSSVIPKIENKNPEIRKAMNQKANMGMDITITPQTTTATTNIAATTQQQSVKTQPTISETDFDRIYLLSEEQMLEEFIKKEFTKANVDITQSLIPDSILKRKKIYNIIFSMLFTAFIISLFFHINPFIYIISLIGLLIFFIVTRKYNLMKYIIKEVKSRPNEKISNIVMNMKNTLVPNKSIYTLLIGLVVGIMLPIIFFWNPRIFYEKSENGYVVRFYTYGVSNITKIDIPDNYKNEKVIGIRGDVFSNLYFIKEINLPDTVTEIRAGAFENDILLEKVKLPKNLKSLGDNSFKNCISLQEIELPDTLTIIGAGAFKNAFSLTNVKMSKNVEKIGGAAFYNCSSLKEMILPDTLTELGGESFYYAESLENLVLSNSLTEIRGNTCEGCFSLRNIVIPASVTRIGGSAFRDCNLESVYFYKESQIQEIGSSAFRANYGLRTVTLPNRNIYINERAFKETNVTITYYED